MGFDGPMGAHFHTTIAPDTFVEIKANLLMPGRYGLCRAVAHAVPTGFAERFIDERPLNEMFSQEAM